MAENYPTDSSEVQNYIRFKTELEYYFKYSELLEKKRSEEARREVEKVVKKVPTIVARIREIERIDNNDRQNYPDIYDERRKTKKRSAAVSVDIDAKETIKEEKIRPIRPSSLIGFIFAERRLLRNFSNATSMLTPKFFGFFFKLSDHFFSCLSDIGQELKPVVFEALKHVIANGWQSLSKKQYNLATVFFAFIKEVSVFIAEAGKDSRKQELMDAMDVIVPFYLQLNEDEENKNMLAEGFQLMLSSDVRRKGALASITDLIMRIFDQKEQGKLNFLQIIMTVFNYCFKKVISLDEITNSFFVLDVTDKYFICTSKIAEKMNKRIHSIDESITELQKELFIIKPVDTKLSAENISNEDFIDICLLLISSSKLIERGKTDRNKLFEALTSDLLKGAQYFSSGFINVFSDILTGGVVIEKKKERKVERIFAKEFFSDYIQTLIKYKTEIEDLKNTTSSNISIDYALFESFVKNRRLELEKEEKACHMIEEIFKAFGFINLRLSAYLFNHYSIMNKGADDPVEMNKLKGKPIIDFKAPPRVLPFYNNLAIGEHFEEGQTVLDILDEIAFFTSNITYLYRLDEVTKFIEKKDILQSKGEALLTEKARYI